MNKVVLVVLACGFLLSMQPVLGNAETLSNDQFSLGEKSFTRGVKKVDIFQALGCTNSNGCLNSRKEVMGLSVKSIAITSPSREGAPVDQIYTVLDDDQSTKSIDQYIPILSRSLGKPTELYEISLDQRESGGSKTKMALLKEAAKNAFTSKEHHAAVWRLGDVNVYLRSLQWNSEKNLIIEYANPKKMLSMLDGSLEKSGENYGELVKNVRDRKTFALKDSILSPSASFVGEENAGIGDESYQQAKLLLSENYYFATPALIAQELDANHVMLWRSHGSDEFIISNRLVSFALPSAEAKVSCDKLSPARGRGMMKLDFKANDSTMLKGRISDAYTSNGLVQLHQYLEKFLGYSINCSEQPDI
jgi:hypothetical protein